MDAALAPAPVGRPGGERPATGRGGLVLACALAAEQRAARRAGARAVRVGLGASRSLPQGRLCSFGLAGALVPGLEPGTLLTATRVVAEDGRKLWEGAPLEVPGARPAVLCAAGRVVDDPAERARLAAQTGAVAVDMESGVLAASGRLAGAVRAVADGPERPVGRLAFASRSGGEVAWRTVLRAFATEPRAAWRAAAAARRGLAALERAARALAEAGS